MSPRSFAPALACAALLSGCGGGGGGGGVAAPPLSPSITGATLRAIVNQKYTVHDLGKLDYFWPGWFLSAGAASISINDNGDVVSALSGTPYVWTTKSVTTLGGRFKSARALNNKGQVAGDTWPPDNANRSIAAIWQNGEVTNLGSLRPDDDSNAFGVNDAGQVVGESAAPRLSNADVGKTHAFIFSAGTLFDLGTLGGDYCRAVAVNNSGQAIGYGPTTGNLQTHAISWQNGQHIDLGTLPGGTYSQANALNDRGQVVGYANHPRPDLFGSPPPRAVLWQSGGIQDLGTLGGPGSYATGINKDGVIVGGAETAELRSVQLSNFGYYYDYFAYYGYGFGIGGNNANGGLNAGNGGGGAGTSATGFAGGGNGRAAKGRAAGDERSFNVAHAFVYADGTMFDVNKLLPVNSGWELSQASAINNKGQIVGIGSFNGQVHGFFLNPQ